MSTNRETMHPSTAVRPTVLLLDIGGVLLSNGWDHVMRRRAAETFGLDLAEIDDRHHLTFDTYEQGRLSLDEYLDRVVFFKERPFSGEEFKRFMFSQSKAHADMIRLVTGLKTEYGLRTAAVSNEGRELTLHRIKTFNLADFIDCFACSCFVHHRKPDKEIFRMALDLIQASPAESVYIDDRKLFVEVAQELGIKSIRHIGYETTRGELSALGLSWSEQGSV